MCPEFQLPWTFWELAVIETLIYHAFFVALIIASVLFIYISYYYSHFRIIIAMQVNSLHQITKRKATAQSLTSISGHFR